MFKSSKKKLIISGCSYTANYAKVQKLEEFPIWGEVLADKLNMELINVGQCGFGNRAIYTTLVEKMIVEKNVGLVVAMWSEFQRMSWHNGSTRNPWQCFLPERAVLDAEWHDQFYKSPTENPKKKSLHYELGKMVRDRELDSIFDGNVQSLGYIFAFQNICENMDIPYLQVQGCWSVMAKYIKPSLEDKIVPRWDRNRSSRVKEFAKLMIDSPYIDKINNNFIGWPISESIGGYCFDSLLSKYNHRISDEDTHPNKEGHKLISEVLYDEYKKIYS